MAIFNPAVPANSEAVKQGASRIREIKASLNSTLSQIFDDALVFLPNWVTGASIQSHASNDALRAISSNHIKTDAILLRHILDGIFTADVAGRAKFAPGFVDGDLLDPAITFPAGVVDSNALALLAVATANLQNNSVTVPKAGTGVAKIAIGSYAGSNSLVATVSGLAFPPDFVILIGGAASNKIGVSFRQESTANIGPIHLSWDFGAVTAPSATAIQWTADGFIISPTSYHFNNGGSTHSYLALKM